MSLRITCQPEADGAGLRIVGIDFENFQVMLAGPGRVMELLSVKIAESKVQTSVIGIFFEKLFKFVHGRRVVVVLFMNQSQVVTGVERIWADGEGILVRGNCSR